LPEVLISGVGVVDLTLTFNPPVRLANELAVVGETISSSGTVRTNSLPRYGELVFPYDATFTFQLTGSVTVPAGPFDVIQLQGGINVPGSGQPPILFTLHLAEEVGIVKSETSQFGASVRAELVAMTTPNPLTIGASSLPEGEMGVPYMVSLDINSLKITGGFPPLVINLIKGSLPLGLTVNPSGTITGIPVKAETKSFTLKVHDSVGYSVSKKVKIKIFDVLGITTKSFKAGRVGKSYGATLKAKGGKKPYAWSLASGNLLSGLSLNSVTGKIAGIPGTSGSFDLTLQVTDPLGGTAQKILTISIGP